MSVRICFVICGLLYFAQAANAGIITTGSVLDNTSYPSSYYVAYAADGTVLIEDDSDLTREYIRVGHASDKTGTATVTGTGSTFKAKFNFYVGESGYGTLNVLDGGLVDGDTDYIGYDSGAAGEANIVGPDSTWNNAYLYVGHSGDGKLNIFESGQVSSDIVHVGLNVGSTGTVTVRDSGSAWTIDDNIKIGRNGSGTMNIRNGATVTNSGAGAYVGYNTGSSGTATVCGAGSNWTSVNAPFIVGYYGIGSLTLCGGGDIGGESLSVGSASAVDVHVTGDDMIVVGGDYNSGSVTNSGVIRLYAAQSLAAGSYSPISERDGRSISWSGGGAYEAFGGVWNASTKVFEVGAVTLLSAGQVEALTANERLRFTDANTGEWVQASFDAVPPEATFRVDLMAQADLDALVALPDVEGQVLAGWQFSTSLVGNDVLLAFDVGAGMKDLAVWHFDGSIWSEYSPESLSYDDAGNFSFTTDNFSGYAVTGVPEPTTLALFALGGVVMLLSSRRARG